jgi:hypothetical protein
MTKITFRIILVTAACMALGSLAQTANALAANDLSAFAGNWKINLEKTHMGRFGSNAQNMVRPPTYTFVFTPEGKNLRHDIYSTYPQAKPNRTMAVIPDGKPHPCNDPVSCLSTGGSSKEQSFVYEQIDSHLLIRIFMIKDRTDECSTYAVSSDGKTFTLITWSPETPYWQNIQVFDKQA